jgi:hypothetical protein
MPLFMLLPLLLLAVATLWALLLPLSLWLRYRNGRARRRAQGWVIRLNAWLLLASTAAFLSVAAIAAQWRDAALRDGGLGLLAGVAVGTAGLWLMRIERDAEGFHYTPNRWLVLALTVAVAARLVLGLLATWDATFGTATTRAAAWQAGGLWALAGLLLGYWLATTWGLRARLPWRSRERRARR